MMFDKTEVISTGGVAALDEHSPQMCRLLKRATPDEIPGPDDIFSPEELEEYLSAIADPPLSLVAVGDIMLAGRTKRVLAERGRNYPFEAVLPILKRAAIILGNLEGPFALKAQKAQRTFSYRVDPDLATTLAHAGINVLTLANNHLLDCDRAGVIETMDVLARAGVASVGAGVNRQAAHTPVVLNAGHLRIGILGYYWNRRTAATMKLAGSAMDPREALEADICDLRTRVDRVVVTFHWGVPYEREPSAEDRAKAHFAVDCGADAIIGHHPHIVQPFEVYRSCPIFYSVGNFAFGSANSRAEGLLIGLRFEESKTIVQAYPLYVKNRDPRVNYQPQMLRGDGAKRVLSNLAAISGPGGMDLKIDYMRGNLVLPSQGPTRKG